MIESPSPLSTPSQPPQPEKKGDGGWISGLGGWLIGKYTEHQAPSSLKGKDVALQKYNPLIKDFSKQITDGLVKEITWLQMGQDSIQTAMEDLIFHIFQVWSKQEADPEGLLPQTADQLAEQLFSNLLTVCTKELERGQPSEITFKNIASIILNETFPNKENDKHLPSALRGILSHSGAVYYATSYFKPELALDWQGFTDLTAKSLQGVYEKFFDPSSKAGIVQKLEEAHPGSSELIEFAVQKIETKAKEPIAIASFSAESNALLNTIVQKFSSEEDVVIQKAKTGFREKVKENMAAVLSTVFEPTSVGQLPQQRREQIVDQLIAATVPRLPQLHKNQAAIKKMEAAEVVVVLNALKDLNDSNKIIDINPSLYGAVKLRLTSILGPIRDPAVSEKVYSEVYRYYQPQIESVLVRIKAGASIDEGRLLLRQIAAHPTLMSMTNFLIDENKIKAALPDIPEVVAKKDNVAKNSIHKLHNILSEYLLQVQDQLDSLDKEGAKSLENLQASGPEVVAYIEEKLAVAQKIVEKKAIAKTLLPTKMKLVDEFICLIIEPGTSENKKIAKEYVSSGIKNIIALVINSLAARHQQQTGQPITAVEVLGATLQTISDKGESAIDTLLQQEVTPERARALAKELKIAISDEALATDKMADTYSHLFFTKTARDILKTVISEEDFEQILPKFVRGGGLYESAAEVFIPQLQALYSMRKEAKERPQIEIPNEFRELITQGVATIKQRAQTKKSNESVEEKLTHALLQTKTASQFIDTILPSLLEMIAITHVRPKDGKTFEDRTAELVLQFITISQGGFDKIDGYNSREDKKQTGAAWLLAHNYTKEKIDAYRKANDLRQEVPIDVEDFLLYETTERLVAALFPKELLDQIIPEEWKSLNLDQQVVSLTRGYLKQVYDCSQVAKRFGVPQVDPGMLKDMSSYIQKQIPQLLAPKKGEVQEQPWMNRVVEKVILTGNEEQQKLLARFASNAIYAGVTALFASADAPKVGNQRVNLIDQFGAPARITHEYFLALNDYQNDKNREKLFEKLSGNTLQIESRTRAYLKAIDKPIGENEAINYEAIDMAHFVYWLSARESLEKFYTDANWEKLVPSFLKTIVTKDLAATFAVSGYQLIHETQKLLQEKEAIGKAITSKHEGLDAFIAGNVIAPVKETLKELGEQSKPLSDKLPPLVDTCLKQALCADPASDIGIVLETVVERAVYAVAGTLLADGGTSFQQIAGDIIETFKKGNHEATAEKIVATLMPADIQETVLTKQLISAALPTITDYVSEVDESLKKVAAQSLIAKKYVEGLDPTGGFNKMLTEIIASVDESIDELSQEKEVSKEYPKVINEFLHTLLEKPELKGSIKEVVHSLIYISLQQALTPVGDETMQEHVERFASGLIASFDASDAKKTGASWLAQILPDKKRKELVPEFLHSLLSYDNITKWAFEPYVKDVIQIKSYVEEKVKPATDENTKRMQEYARKEFHKQAEMGFAEYGGFVKGLGMTLLNLFKNQGIVDTFLDGMVAQFMGAATEVGKLDTRFLTAKLTSALSALKGDAVDPKDMPPAEEFNKSAANRLLKIGFPKGIETLPGEKLKNTGWKQLEGVAEGLIKDVTDRDSRILFTLDSLLSMTTDDKEKIKKRQTQVAELRKAGSTATSFHEKSERLVKDFVLDAAMHAVDTEIDKKGWWAPFKWIAKAVVKSITYLVVKHSVRDRVWDFIASAETDKKMRRFIWAMLAPVDKEAITSANKESLAEQFQSVFTDSGLLPWYLRGSVSSGLAGYYEGKTFVDLLAPLEERVA